MIDYHFNTRKEFYQSVQTFADNNEIHIYFALVFISAVGTPENIQKLQVYIEELELARTKYRRSKSYIWQLFH